MTDVAHQHQGNTPSWAEARRTSFESAAPLPAENVPLYEAVGRLLASDVVALYDIPHFASSAMDGWAVSGDGPWTIVAGPVVSLARGNATAIVTGYPVPSGTRGVLRSENGELRDGRLDLGPRAAPGEPSFGQHVRAIGEEATVGEIVVRECVDLRFKGVDQRHNALETADFFSFACTQDLGKDAHVTSLGGRGD